MSEAVDASASDGAASTTTGGGELSSPPDRQGLVLIALTRVGSGYVQMALTKRSPPTGML
jgi:hypothetical protein